MWTRPGSSHSGGYSGTDLAPHTTSQACGGPCSQGGQVDRSTWGHGQRRVEIACKFIQRRARQFFAEGLGRQAGLRFQGEKQTGDKNQAKEQREWKKGGLARMVGKKVEETFGEWKVITTMLGRTEPQPPLDVEQPDRWRVAFVAEAGTCSGVS